MNFIDYNKAFISVLVKAQGTLKLQGLGRKRKRALYWSEAHVLKK